MALKHRAGLAAIGAVAMLITACGGDDSAEPDAGSGDAETAESDGEEAGDEGSGEISGDITVLTHRTDLVDTIFQEYKEQFEAEYPDVTVSFEAITDYEGDVSIRLNTDDYGDVLVIPNTVSKDQLSEFFLPLGTVEEMSETYRFVREQSYEGQAYGVAITGNAQGYVFNKKIWAEAGITEPPATPEEFISALEAIAENTDAVPYYTNYADGWPMSQWQGNRGVVEGAAAENTLAANGAPWAEGEEQYVIDSLLYDIVAGGLSEEDPTTTNWEESKNLLGSGQVATMMLGSWAVVQMQDAAEAAGGSPDDIGYWPFPFQVDGQFQSTIGGDYKNAISVHTEHPEAARAWIEWFAHESGYSEQEGGLSPTVGGELPATLADFEPLDLELVEVEPAPPGEESLLSDIYNSAEIDLWGNVYRQRLVDIARGAADGDKDSYFAELNNRWSRARGDVTG